MPRPPRTNGGLPASVVVFVTVFVDLIGFGIVLPLLPGYAARFGSGETMIGLLVASFPLMQFLVAPWWGRLSDRIGRRPVILIGLFGSAVSYLLFGLAGSFGLLLLSRIVAGATGATVNVAQAYLADVTPPERRAQSMGLIGAAFGLGFIVGPALGGVAIRFGTAAPGLVAATLSLLSFAVAWVRLPESRTAGAAVLDAPGMGGAVFDLLRGQSIPFGVMFCTTLAFTVMYLVFPLYAAEVLGYGPSQTAYFYVFLGLISTIVQGWLVGRLAPLMGERALMVAGAVLMAAGFAALPFPLAGPAKAAPLERLLLALGLVAAGSGLTSPSLAGYVSRRTAAADQGRTLGGLQSVGSVGRILGPPLAGILSEAAGYRSPFLAAALVALLAAGLSAKLTSAR